MSEEPNKEMECMFCHKKIDHEYVSFWTPGEYCNDCGSDYEGGVLREMAEARAGYEYEECEPKDG